MTANRLKIIVSGSLATIAELLGKIADAPPALQNQIPQMFPEAIRGYVAMTCQTIGGIAFVYALFVAHRPASDLAAKPEVITQSPFNTTPKSAVITTKLAPIVIALLCLSLAGCDTIDLEHGKIVSWGDSTNVTIKWHGNEYHHDTLLHSTVWDANGRWVGSVGGAVAGALLANGTAKAVAHGSTSGVQLLGAMPAIAHPIVNRKTNRVIAATPIPR